MWTDEQLLDQGWTVEQITTYRAEKAAEVISTAPESVIPATVVPKHSIPMLEDTFVAPMKAVGPIMSNSTMTAILMATLLAIVPFSLYSISNAEGTQGPSGDVGMSGMNGSNGSSFHLVTSADVLPPCDDSVNNQIFFIAVDAAFQVCQNSMWTPIDLMGQSGINGTNGASGTNGLDGTDGTDGADGTNGADGTSGADGTNGADGADGALGNNGLASLIVTRSESILEGCTNGGIIVETGVDDNGDNTLSLNEVDSVIVVCNGVSGQDGADGDDGADGSSTGTMMVARLSAAPASMGCNGTGELLEQGMDDGRNGGIAQNGVLENSEVLFRTLICTQFDLEMVEDFNPGATGSNPSNFVSINSTMYFTANNGTASGIWAYENGTISLVYSGSIFAMRAIGSQLMFAEQTSSFGIEPFVFDPSNGTAWQIADISSGSSGSFPGEYTLIGTSVYFAATDSSGIFDLWAYETQNFSVWKVEADIQPTSLIAVHSDLYFSAGPSNGNVELWKHETANNTTFMVKDINPGILSSSPQHLVLMGTTIYMSANDGGSAGTELYAYDLTNNSTWLAADIRPGVATSSLSDLTVMGTRLYMQATSGTHFELWAYESTNNSLLEVTNFQSTSGFGGPSGFTVFDGKLYFKADDGSGAELWATSPTNSTVWLAQEINSAGASSPTDFHVFGGTLFFVADDGTNGRELWSVGAWSQNISFV